jgi:outer membrane protein assembly factor BamA
VKRKPAMLIGKTLCYSLLMLASSTCAQRISAEEAKQDSAEVKRSGLVGIPFLFYTPETKIAAGGAVNHYFREPKSEMTSRPSSIELSFIYTQKKQLEVSLDADLYWRDEAYHLSGAVRHTKFPDLFYGIGHDTSEDDEEEYTHRTAEFQITFLKRARPGLYLGILYDFRHSKIIKREENGLLSKGNIPGSEGGRTAGAGILVNWDTRDNIFSATSGSFHQLSATLFGDALGGDYKFNKYTLDFRQYFPIFASHVLAFQAYLNFITGDPPYHSLSLLGGQDLMRGHYQGRYRDKMMLAFQTEYRMPVWWRLGLVGFAGLGEVASEMGNFELSNFKYSLGLGVRYEFIRAEKINLRLDIGYGGESFQLYANMLEAF